MPFDEEAHVAWCVSRLTKRQREILQWLVDHEDDADGDGELVQEGKRVWYGLETTSPGLVVKLTTMMAISCDHVGALVERWRINSTGKAILAAAKEKAGA
jgi:hypothetical protein